jgi:tetratricopeptide (TPR) repeat protein
LLDHIYLLLQNGKHQEAILSALSSFESDTSDADALVLYVGLLLDHGFFEKAEQVLDSSGITPSSDLNVYFLYRDLYSRSGQLQKLESIDHGSGGVGAIGIPKAQGKVFKYDKSYFSAQVVDFSHDLIKQFNINDRDVKKSYLLAKEGMVNEALFHLNSYSKNCDDMETRYLIRAEISLVEGKYSKAKRMYAHLRDFDSYKFLALNRLGDISNAEGHTDRAQKYYLMAKELEPSHLDTLLDLMKTEFIVGNTKKAKRYYNQAREKYGDSVVAKYKPALSGKTYQPTHNTVTGLVWSEITGNSLPIEIVTEESTGHEICCTGHIGYLMRDSINTVVNALLRSEYREQLKHSVINIHIPDASIYKDGASAGLAFLVGLVSRITHKSLATTIAFTGEVSLSGRVLPVGGIPEKLFGAYMQNMKQVFLPAANHYELRNVPAEIKSNMEFCFVNHYQEALDILWKN